MLPPRIYLASRSPRRRELLHQIGVAFDTLLFRAPPREDADVAEDVLPGEHPDAYVVRVARAKAQGGWTRLAWRNLVPRPVLSADTTIDLDGEIIGKPADEADAAAILRRLAGRSHRVLTAIAIADGQRIEYLLSTSEVHFREIDDEEIRHYVMSGEPMDKAGAYGIQGRAGLFVEYLAGSYTGVMGLPVCETGELLKRLGFRPL